MKTIYSELRCAFLLSNVKKMDMVQVKYPRGVLTQPRVQVTSERPAGVLSITHRLVDDELRDHPKNGVLLWFGSAERQQLQQVKWIRLYDQLACAV